MADYSFDTELSDRHNPPILYILNYIDPSLFIISIIKIKIGADDAHQDNWFRG